MRNIDLIAAIERAILHAITSRAWLAAPDDEARKRVIMRSLSEALCLLGSRKFPSPDLLGRYFGIVDRDGRIAAEFDGRNYGALAARYQLTPRRVRDIVERMRRKRG